MRPLVVALSVLAGLVAAVVTWRLVAPHPTAAAPIASTRYMIDIGHPTDVLSVGPGFSYQEGAAATDDAWRNDQDFRWSRPGCRVRIPVAPGNTHEITLRGHVPVGFGVNSGGVELARFPKPDPGNAYTFTVSPKQLGDRHWLELTLVNITPMPLPNLDLRELFWALEKIEITSSGPATPVDFECLPASSLLDAAFRAALSRLSARPAPIPLSARARWDLPAGFKTPAQLAQEALTVLSEGAEWTLSAEDDPADAAFLRANIAPAVQRELVSAWSGAPAAAPAAEVGILIGRNQLAAARINPSNRMAPLESARGAFAILRRLQIPVTFLDESDVARAPGRYKAIIVPKARDLGEGVWDGVRQFVESGGVVLVTATQDLPLGDDEVGIKLRSLLGITAARFERWIYFVPLGDDRIRLYNSDSQALLSGSAETLLPLLSQPNELLKDAQAPFVAINRLGSGAALTLTCDLFTRFDRYGDPQHTRLIGFALDAALGTRLVVVQNAPTIAAGVFGDEDRRIVHLVNTARGEFDAAGLMNAARTAVFAEQIPATEALSISLRCRRVVALEVLPPDAGMKWNWANGNLNVELSPIALYRRLIATMEQAAISNREIP